MYDAEEAGDMRRMRGGATEAGVAEMTEQPTIEEAWADLGIEVDGAALEPNHNAVMAKARALALVAFRMGAGGMNHDIRQLIVGGKGRVGPKQEARIHALGR